MNKTLSRALQSAICILTCAAAYAAVPDGYVVRVESSTVYLDWGTDSGTQPGDRFTVYREGEALKHPKTGEVLGHAEESVASGTLDSIQPKFSIGHLYPGGKEANTGDRSRWGSAAATAPAAPAAVVAESKAVLAAGTLAELWRSEPLDKNPVGMTFADLDGDGRKDLIVAFRSKIQAYHWKDKKLVPFAQFDSRSFRHWLAIDAADVKQDGHAEIFATAFLDGIYRARVVVLRYQDGVFKEVGDIEGFARAVDRAGVRHVYWQNLSRSVDLHLTEPSEIVWEKGAYRTGPTQDLRLMSDQLFGYVWGDWDKDGKEDLAVLEHGERVRIYAQDVKWKSSEVYGGTKNDFAFNENVNGSLYPRLTHWRPAGEDRDQLIVPTNISTLGVRMTYLKLYEKSEISGLAWNGLEMRAAWKVRIEGYLADYGVADVMGQSKPQLWTAVAGPGNKTLLVSYDLPGKDGK